MNQAHLEALASEEWRETLRDRALPFALGELSAADLGDDVLEIGPGPGLTTELLAPQVPHLTSAELQDALFADVLRVLRPGGVLVASDSVASEDLERFHEDDTYNPIDPSTLVERLRRIGWVDIDVDVNPYAWACRARRAAT
jgi:protein-L-isoaspartate O-methyltransferase